MSAADKRARAARGAAVVRMVAEARVTIEAIRAVPAAHLTEGTRHAAKQVAELAAVQLEHIAALPAHVIETWRAVVNLTRALQRTEAALSAPEAWGGLPMVFEAGQLLTAAQMQAVDAQRLARQRAKGRPLKPTSKAGLIRQASAERPGASSETIARIVRAKGEDVDARQVRSVRRRAAKP